MPAIPLGGVNGSKVAAHEGIPPATSLGLVPSMSTDLANFITESTTTTWLGLVMAGEPGFPKFKFVSVPSSSTGISQTGGPRNQSSGSTRILSLKNLSELD